MLTLLTQAAIKILSNIYIGTKKRSGSPLIVSLEATDVLLCKLTAAGLIRLVNMSEDEPNSLQISDAVYVPKISHDLTSYCLTRPPSEISLFDILEAIEEPLDCSKEVAESFYITCGRAAQKLGVINQVAKIYLKQIKLYDL